MPLVAPFPPGPGIERPDPFPDVNLLDGLLAGQHQLQTPVARFAEEHENGSIPPRTDLYRHLIPLEAPRTGERYAFQVELDKCTGCKSCVAACHSLNGLDDDEAWRDVGLLADDANAFVQTVTSACHHCESPECLHGCPVAAYEKDSRTGIVRHLDDQCIGCEYCILKCPYDAPKYSKRRGIVRKCDMCHQRLAAGEAPACVQACPTEAIRIVKVESGAPNDRFLPGAPDPARTSPPTRFTGRKVPATATAADQNALVPQPAHWPLVGMLTLTQAGIGFCTAAMMTASRPLVLLGALLFLAGLGASILHLGRPLGAWRFFLGLRTSWLSREILAFSLVPPLMLLGLIAPRPALLLFLPAALLAIVTSVMVYHDTGRVTWRFALTAMRFLGTALVCSLSGLLLTGALSPGWCVLALAAKLSFEFALLVPARRSRWSAQQHSALLQLGPLRPILLARFGLAAVAMVAIFVTPLGALAVLLTGELLERLLFFRAVHAPKMPGPAA